MALTLVQFWQAERDAHEAAQTAAQNDLAMAQQALVTAKSTLDADVAALNLLNAGIAANRTKLPTTSVPSELTALNTIIRDQLNKQRALQGTIFDDQDAVSWSQASATAATSTLTRTTSRLTDSANALASAKDANKQRQSMKAQLAVAPFDTLQSDATSAAAGAVATDAKAEIDASFPATLQTIAGKRYITRTARELAFRQSVLAVETAWGAALAANNGLSGTAGQQAIVFRQADQALRDYANAAKQRYDRALGVLSRLQALKNGTKTPDLLTAQEQVDVAANAARAASETNVEVVDAARGDVNIAITDLDTQILTQIGTDVDKLTTDATVKAKRDAVVAKIAALKTAQGTADISGDRKTMDDWQIVVQDAAWQSLIDYLDANAALADLKATAPATLAAALDAAEAAYATALAASTKAQRQADALADALALRTDRATASTAALPSRLLSAVRGDSY
jgi:hypothetical protein